jgi:hypothetical protein
MKTGVTLKLRVGNTNLTTTLAAESIFIGIIAQIRVTPICARYEVIDYKRDILEARVGIESTSPVEPP